MENKFYIENRFELANAAQESDFLKIEGYCCHFNIKNLNDQVTDSKSFDTFFEMYNSGKLKPVLNFNHDPEMVIGGIDDVAVMDEGLYMQARLNMNVPLVRDMIAPNVLAGDIDSFSTEGRCLNPSDDLIALKAGGYYIKNFILTAVAVVTTPADWMAKFSISNYFDEYRKLQSAEEEIKKTRLGYVL